ncbi:cell wall hydrolase [Candidatus Magnetobacterium casense]|uniref:Cell wall hydrolase n=1 Tax=Candidatus Magnetobacterium casense TaxID=1455061 RepID=A0ABS6RU79_9BACT|nr:cell wall hydrolase [Candidatus Magnetobacterium casensis]MBV6340182.1 cell wall hydrolase [Candidatus Magnetobacterium casensis]
MATPEMLLATTILCEAGGEPELGKQAVAQVVMNRSNDKKHRYGNGLKEVILHRYAFSYLNPDGLIKAEKMLAGIYQHGALMDMAFQFLHNLTTCSVVKGATHYYNPQLASPMWAQRKQMMFVAEIDNHRFYQEL